MNSPACMKCSGTMQRGFLLDRLHRGDGSPSQWLEGEPEHSLCFGIKTRGKARRPVGAHRCERCGWVELYAPNE